jgi:hypothetical protein
MERKKETQVLLVNPWLGYDTSTSIMYVPGGAFLLTEIRSVPNAEPSAGRVKLVFENCSETPGGDPSEEF